MGLFDLLLLLAQIAIPVVLAATAFADWRSLRRTRYLVLFALYSFFTLVIGADYYFNGSDPLVCFGSLFWVLVAALYHMRSRRIDRTPKAPPPIAK
jgi:hypothetical protein